MSVPWLRHAASSDGGDVIGVPPRLQPCAAVAAPATSREEEGHPLSRSETSGRHPIEKSFNAGGRNDRVCPRNVVSERAHPGDRAGTIRRKAPRAGLSLMRPRGLEPQRELSPTRPSTLDAGVDASTSIPNNREAPPTDWTHGTKWMLSRVLPQTVRCFASAYRWRCVAASSGAAATP